MASQTLILSSIQQVRTEQPFLTRSWRFKVSQFIQCTHRQLRSAKKLNTCRSFNMALLHSHPLAKTTLAM